MGKTSLVRSVLRTIEYLEGGAVEPLRWKTYLPLSRALQSELRGDPEEVASETLRQLRGRALFVDDLHWADPGTLAVVSALAGNLPLVVATRSIPGELAAAVEPVTIELSPLPAGVSRTLCQRLHPHLGPDEVERLVRAAGGNPLLLHHLVREGRATPTLRAAVAARLAELSPPVVATINELALYGRPLPIEHLGVDVGELPPELVLVSEGNVTLGHALLAEAAIEMLDPPAKAAAHVQLAGRLNDVDASEHLLAGGDRPGALAAARRAVSTTDDPVVRAHLLSVAARASGDGRLRVDAAAALVTVGSWLEAEDHARQVGPGDPQLFAEAAYHLSRSRWFAGDVGGARRALDDGISAVGGDNSPILAKLVVEGAHQHVRTQEASGATAQTARRALTTADDVGVDVPRARMVLATALAHDGTPGWEETFRAVIPEAAERGDTETECAAAFFLASHLGFGGRPREAIALLEDATERARAHGQLTWHVHMEGALLTDRFLAGEDPRLVVSAAEEFIANHPLFRNRAQAELVLALSLGDLDRGQEAGDRLAVATTKLTSSDDQSILLAASSELAWLTGDLRAALERADAAAEFGAGWFGIGAGAAAAAAYACFELDRPITFDAPAAKAPIFAACAAEVAALGLWDGGDGRSAVAALDAAAEQWQGIGTTRYALRARWAAGDIAARSGHPSALRRLESVRLEAQLWGARPIARRAAATLSRWQLTTALTRQEMTIIALVGEGLTSAAIANRLAIAPATVESHVKAALRKLGVHTRREAALKLGRT